MTKAALGGRAIQRAATRVKPEQASKVMMRMPTRLKDGEGSTDGEAIDARSHLIRRGNGRGTFGRVKRVIGGDPSRSEVAASTSLLAMDRAGVGQGSMTVEAG